MKVKLLLSFSLLVIAANCFQSCFSCAQQNYGRNYMCYEKGLFADPYEVSCCSSNTDKNCDPRERRLSCSKTYNVDKHAFYTFCPRINGTSCGLDSNNLTIEASPEKQTFKYEDLRYA